jgi:hypothetical protein
MDVSKAIGILQDSARVDHALSMVGPTEAAAIRSARSRVSQQVSSTGAVDSATRQSIIDAAKSVSGVDRRDRMHRDFETR